MQTRTYLLVMSEIVTHLLRRYWKRSQFLEQINEMEVLDSSVKGQGTILYIYSISIFLTYVSRSPHF